MKTMLGFLSSGNAGTAISHRTTLSRIDDSLTGRFIRMTSHDRNVGLLSASERLESQFTPEGLRCLLANCNNSQLPHKFRTKCGAVPEKGERYYAARGANGNAAGDRLPPRNRMYLIAHASVRFGATSEATLTDCSW